VYDPRLGKIGYLAMARANKLKQILVEKGINPSKIKSNLGSATGCEFSATYSITTSRTAE